MHSTTGYSWRHPGGSARYDVAAIAWQSFGKSSKHITTSCRDGNFVKTENFFANHVSHEFMLDGYQADHLCLFGYGMDSQVPPIAALALPTDEDTLPVLSVKLSSFLYVLHVNRCIATATRSTSYKVHDQAPEARARSQMTHHEQEYFLAWKEGTLRQLPPIDWDIDRGRTPTSERPMKKALRRAEALNRIYQTDRAEPCHYIFFTENHLV